MITTVLYTIWDFLKNNWEPILALLAIIISLLTLYYTQWDPFHSRIYSAGRYALSINPQNSSQIALSPSLIFANEGAKNGIIENLALIIDIEGKKILLIPLRTLTNKNLNETQTAAPLESEAFTKFYLTEKEVTIKQIMFVPQFIEKFTLLPGEYTAEIFVKTSESNKFKKHDSLTLQIDQADIDEITKGIPTNLKPGERVYTQALFKNKITPEFENEYEGLKSYLEKE